MLRLAANLPQPLVGFSPVLERSLHESGQAFPQRRRDLGGIVTELDVDGVEQHSPHVVLALIPRAIAHPDRARAAPSGQVIDRPLGELMLSADAVHDLHLDLLVQVAGGDRVDDEAEVVDRFPTESEAVKRPEHER